MYQTYKVCGLWGIYVHPIYMYMYNVLHYCINFKDEIRNSFIKVSCLSDAQIIIIQNIVYSELCFLLERGPGLIYFKQVHVYF